MASRRLVPASVRESLLGIPSDIGSLERNYVLPDEDLELRERDRPESRSQGAACAFGSSDRLILRTLLTEHTAREGQGIHRQGEQDRPRV